MKHCGVVLAALLLAGVVGIRAEDWPEFRGKDRQGVWNETGIIEKFPASGLKVVWRVPVKAGYTGASVVAGRVFVTDYEVTKKPYVKERLLALDEKTGRILWTHEWPANYTGLLNNDGPRATPTVDGDRVYALGAAGDMFCLKVTTGEMIWQKNFVKEYGIELPPWGSVGAPIIDGRNLIAIVGANTLSTYAPVGGEAPRDGKGQVIGKVMAFDKLTGKEVWRSLPMNTEAGYSHPIIITAGATRQLIIWHAAAVSSLDPATGEVNWEHPFKSFHGAAVATPIVSGLRLFITQYYTGAIMFELDPKLPRARMLWKGKEEGEMLNDTLHSMISTPVIDGDTIYGICSFGQLRALDARTGERLWETQAATTEKRRHTTAFLVRNGNRYFINNDRGDLIIARLSPKGYEEISRTPLIKPTTGFPGTRRELNAVNWSHPAYANRHIIQRNDEEIIRASLDAKDYQ